jgi:hypothetical protein
MEDTEALERNGMANKVIEKYLKISDFLKHILNNPDIFLDQKYEGVQTKAEERRILLEFLKLFLLTVQDSIDYEQTIKVAIEQNIQGMLIDELFEQTDESITNGGDEKIDKDGYHGKKYERSIFGR